MYVCDCSLSDSVVACRWGFAVTLLYPALAASVWFACIKTGNPYLDKFGEKALWLFLVNPTTGTYLSFLTLMLFFTSLDEDHPWRPLKNYYHILVAVYAAQVRTSPLCAPRLDWHLQQL
jgi:hypothetical protein